MKRKMFSITTMASSITMPTESVKRQQREAVEREAHVVDDGERRDDRGGDRQGRDDRRPDVGQEEEHDDRRQDAADDQVLLHRIDRGLDEDRLVADDLDVGSPSGMVFRSDSSRSFSSVATSTVFVPDCLRMFSSTQGVSL